MSRWKLAGHLSNGEAFYTAGQGWGVEKDFRHLVETTQAEIKEIGEIRLRQLEEGKR